MSARLLLAKLAESGLIELPPRQRRGGRQRLRVLSEPELFWLASQSAQPIQSPLEALRPLEVLLIEARTKEANDFICHLHQHHYLASGGLVSITLLSIFLLRCEFFCKMRRRGVGRPTLATQH